MFAIPLNSPKAGVDPFVFTQSVPAATWDIFHNLGRSVQVTLVDGQNEQMIAEVLHVNANTLQVRFGGPECGRAFII